MIVNGKSNAATFKGAETDIYNASLKQVSVTRQKLLDVYKQALNNIEVNMRRLREKGATASVQRLEVMQRQVLAEIKSLNATQQAIITSGYIKNFEGSYYGNGYEYERYVNTQIATKKSYDLGYVKIDRDYIIASLQAPVGGETFGQRSTAHILKLRQELRQSIGVAMIQGDSAATTARNIQSGITGIGKAMSKSMNASMTIARTELLKAYSLGLEVATNQAEVSGVDVFPTWNATLDGKTRPAHGDADQKKFILDANAEWVLTVGGVVFSSPRVPRYSAGGNVASQIINCRCRRNSNPFGFQPATRVARTADGAWEEKSGQMNYLHWAKTRPGRKEIERTIADRSLRARELRIMRSARGRSFTTQERRTLADIRKQIKGRSPQNVGTRTRTA